MSKPKWRRKMEARTRAHWTLGAIWLRFIHRRTPWFEKVIGENQQTMEQYCNEVEGYDHEVSHVSWRQQRFQEKLARMLPFPNP